MLHNVIPGRPLRLSTFGASCASSNSNSLLRSGTVVYRCCRPLNIFGISSRDLRSNLTFETSTSPICICTFCTTRIVVFPQEKITSQNTQTYSMKRTTTPTVYRIATSIKNIYGTESVALSHEDFREITFFPTPIHKKQPFHANLRPHSSHKIRAATAHQTLV